MSFPFRSFFAELIINFLILMCFPFQLFDFFKNLFEITLMLGEKDLKIFNIYFLFLLLFIAIFQTVSKFPELAFIGLFHLFTRFQILVPNGHHFSGMILVLCSYFFIVERPTYVPLRDSLTFLHLFYSS